HTRAAHPTHPGRARGRHAPALLLARVQAPRAQRQAHWLGCARGRPTTWGVAVSTVEARTTTGAWERYVWVAGIVFVVALLAESVIATGPGLPQNDSPAKIASGLHEHRERLLAIAYFSAVYAVAFVIYLCSLYNLLRRDVEWARILGYLLLVGG